MRSNSEVNYEIDHKLLSKGPEIRKAQMKRANTYLKNSSKANNPKQDLVSPYPQVLQRSSSFKHHNKERVKAAICNFK